MQLSQGGIYTIAALLMRYYLSVDSLQYFEMVPTYVPSITVRNCENYLQCC